MDNYEIALEQQGGNDYSTPVGTHFTVRLEDKASFGRVLYEGSKIVGVPFMIATVLETDRKRFRFRLVSPTTIVAVYESYALDEEDGQSAESDPDGAFNVFPATAFASIPSWPI